MKQLSIYDNEYLNEFDTSNQAKTWTSALCHQLPAAKADSEADSEADNSKASMSLSQADTDIQEQQAFPANVTEIVLTKEKIDSIQLILPMLINLHQEKRWLAWIDPPIQLLKEWQKTHQESALNDIMILRSNDNLSVFELSKRALEAGTCHAVIAWTNNLNQDQFSKLETASSIGNSHGIILKSRMQSI
tara:strand:- start:13117 stop:13686 length:570 start_codon:yes stop_codon:yes gene_type:complete